MQAWLNTYRPNVVPPTQTALEQSTSRKRRSSSPAILISPPSTPKRPSLLVARANLFSSSSSSSPVSTPSSYSTSSFSSSPTLSSHSYSVSSPSSASSSPLCPVAALDLDVYSDDDADDDQDQTDSQVDASATLVTAALPDGVYNRALHPDGADHHNVIPSKYYLLPTPPPADFTPIETDDWLHKHVQIPGMRPGFRVNRAGEVLGVRGVRLKEGKSTGGAAVVSVGLVDGNRQVGTDIRRLVWMTFESFPALDPRNGSYQFKFKSAPHTRPRKHCRTAHIPTLSLTNCVWLLLLGGADRTGVQQQASVASAA